jgi:hypothetical protein
MKDTEKKFKLGDVVMTNGLKTMIERETLVPQYIIKHLLTRHVTGDWGDVDDEDKQTNNDGVDNGNRLVSSYTVSGEKVWIITEADRSTTTLLLPEEY